MQAEELRRWVAGRGGVVHPALRIEERPGDGRGVYLKSASDGIAPGTCVLRMPPHCLLSSEHAKDVVPRLCWEFDEWEDIKLLPEDLCALALLLVHEKRKADTSPLALYIQSLPSEEDVRASFTLWWPDELQVSLNRAREVLLHGGFAMDDPTLESLTHKLCEDTSELKSLVGDQHLLLSRRASTAGWQVPTLDEYKWAWCVVNSRSFDCDEPSDMLFAGGVERHSVLAPFVDMLNHGRDGAGQTCRWSLIGGDLCVETVNHINRGDQLLFDYNRELSGRLPLEQDPPFYFLLYYGFVEDVRGTHSCVRSLL